MAKIRFIHVDWLTLNCSGPAMDVFRDNIAEASAFHFVEKEYGTRHFRTVFEVYKFGEQELYCTICCDPFSVKGEEQGGIFSFGACTVKLSNFNCYQDPEVVMFNHFLSLIKLSVSGISRLDICCDLQYFDNGMSVSNLVNGYLTQKYSRISAKKFQAIGIDSTTKKYECLKWGSGASRVSVKIYNKTKEMADTTPKVYIQELWSESKLFVENKDVWRIEFSMNSEGICGINEAGSKCKVQLCNLFDPGYLSRLFFSYAERYIRFRYAVPGRRKTRCKPILLFSNYDKDEAFYPKILRSTIGMGRSHSSMIKRLLALSSYQPLPPEIRNAFINAASAASLITPQQKRDNLQNIIQQFDGLVFAPDELMKLINVIRSMNSKPVSVPLE